MKVMFLADLHHDFWAGAGRDPFEGSEKLMKSLDALVLAGDVSNKPKVRWKKAFAALKPYVAPEKTFVFPGNHDYYDYRLDADDRLADFARTAGVHFVADKSLTFGSTRVLTSTLWTDMDLGGNREGNMAICRMRMNDYRYIKTGMGKFYPAKPLDTRDKHLRHRDFLERELARPFDGETWVVTHHAPHPDCLTPDKAKVAAAYASDLTEMMCGDHAPAKWLHGHVHATTPPFTVGNTEVVNVSMGGYESEVSLPSKRLEELVFDL